MPSTSDDPQPEKHDLSPEENPWRNASYLLTTLQLMATLLDLFMESGSMPSIHYTITTLQFVPALFLTVYQVVRIHGMRMYMRGTSNPWDARSRKPYFLLLLAFIMQLYVLIISAIWYNISSDVNSHSSEWSVFAIVLLWSLVNPATYSSVVSLEFEETSSTDTNTQQKTRLGPGAACWSVFTKHFMKEKLLFVLGATAAVGQAVLGTYQGAIINELTKLVTKNTVDPVTGELKLAATYQEVEIQAATLVGVWAAANFARFIFDVLSALMFSRLEVWLRGEVFEKAITYAQNQKAFPNADANLSDPAAEFGARYASDVQGVISLYGTLLRGVIVNIIMIITNFAFLVLYNWEVAVATLFCIAMSATSGPTDLAGNAAISSQKKATEGLGMLSECVRSISNTEAVEVGLDGEGETQQEHLCQKHTDEIMVPLRKTLFSQILYTNSVDTYINFFSSFLTVIVVITMSYSVYDGEMDSSDFLGVFYVFKQLQKPAMKFSGVLKSLIKNSANLDRLNQTIFPIVLTEPVSSGK